MITAAEFHKARLKHLEERTIRENEMVREAIDSILHALASAVQNKTFKVYVKETKAVRFVSPESDGTIVYDEVLGNRVRGFLKNKGWTIQDVVELEPLHPLDSNYETLGGGVTKHYMVTA